METKKIDVPRFEGFECIGILIPGARNDLYLLTTTLNGNLALVPSTDIAFALMPQLCYRKIKPRRIILEETEEVRQAKSGEAYMNQLGDLVYLASCGTSGEYKIWRVVEDQS